MPYRDKEQQKTAVLESYTRNKGAFRLRQHQQRQRAADYIWEIKRKSGCQKCPERDPCAIDFHHRDPDEKEYSASKMISNKWNNDRIDAEVAKCDIICANCHRKEHYRLLLESGKTRHPGELIVQN